MNTTEDGNEEWNFCTDEFLDLNLTWNTDSPDFTLCFHSTALTYLPCIYLWVFLPIYLGMHYTKKHGGIDILVYTLNSNLEGD